MIRIHQGSLGIPWRKMKTRKLTIRQNRSEKKYKTIGQTPAVSRIIPQEGEQHQQTHASQGLAHSSAANYMSTIQPN
ncbi:unnamed protein product [Nezara viridula]|uniref:Uncharacterized protein n=1 Tax=Nezara viridula TaxID=85310 RepID=A0A9P0H354_NEZVI|nr:unnamed protein product [Nezara viridula]